MRNRSIMNHRFSDLPRVDIPRSTFDRSTRHLSSFDSDYLIPILVDELLPASTHSIDGTILMRLNSPLVKPIMDNCYAEVFAFVVPFRLVWKNWIRFMGERAPDPDSSIDYTIPIISSGVVAAGSLSDYFGIPTGVAVDNCSALYHRAYGRIWNEWFRDQNLQDSNSFGQVYDSEGPDSSGYHTSISYLQKRGKRHDYFTSCFPYPQRLNADDTTITLPLGTSADVLTDSSPRLTGAQNALSFKENDGTAVSGNYALGANSAELQCLNNSTGGFTGLPLYPDNLYADLTNATAASVNSVRLAFQLQKMLEKDMRSGTRYPEILMGHFGVTDPQMSVLQRPEYIGGTKARLDISTVPQTSESGVTDQGNLAAYGTIMANFSLTKSVTEHSILMILLSVQADLTYQTGLRRMFMRETREDFYFPSLAHLGEQAVTNAEIYYQGTSADEDVFGYQERWAEYRYFPSQITGHLRSDYVSSLDVYHLSEDFATLPTLGDTFIQSSTTSPLDRAIAVPSEHQWIMDAFFNIKSTLPMPVYSVPGLIDHF